MPHGYARGRVFNLVLLATAQAEAGRVDQAAHTGVLAVDSAGAISSTRTLNYLRDLNRRLAPYRDNSQVQDFARRTSALVSVRSDVPARPSGR